MCFKLWVKPRILKPFWWVENCIFLNWRIIALQCCVGFCHQHESAVSMHVFPPSLPPFHGTSPSHRSRLSQSTRVELPGSHSKFPLAGCFTYGNLYVSMLLSEFVPPSPSPAVTTSLFSMSLHLYCCPADQFSRWGLRELVDGLTPVLAYLSYI